MQCNLHKAVTFNFMAINTSYVTKPTVTDSLVCKVSRLYTQTVPAETENAVVVLTGCTDVVGKT